MLRLLGLFLVFSIAALVSVPGGRAQTRSDVGSLTAASSNNFPPVNLLDSEGRLTGFGRELSTAVIKATGGEVSYIHSSRWTEVLDMLAEGKADFIHDTGYTPERTATLDFSEPILTMPERIFVLKDRFDIASLDSLRGQKVACVNQHITHLYLQKIPRIDCVVFATPPEGLKALVDGGVDAFIYPRQIVLYYAQKTHVTGRIKTIGDPVRTLTWHMAVKKGNHDVLVRLNNGIAKVKASGEYHRIYDKWFGKIAIEGHIHKEIAVTIGIVLALGATAVGGFVIWNWTLRRTVRRATGELADSERRFHRAFESSPTGSIVIDDSGIIEIFNEEAERIFGYSAADIVGKNVKLLMPEPDRSQHDSAMQEFLDTGEAKVIGVEQEVSGLRKSGETFPLALGVAECGYGDHRKFIGTIRDLTERKALEERAEKSRMEAVRTQELYLRELQADLHKFSRLSDMGQFSASLTHELSQPLTAILNYLQACRKIMGGTESNTSVKVDGLIEKAVDQAKRTAKILHGLKDMVHDGEPSRAIEDVNTGVEEATTLGLTGLVRRDLSVEFNFAKKKVPVLINKVQIQQVVQNLVRNAAEAVADSKTRHLKVRTAYDREGMVRISVSDTGPGLTDEMRGRLFQPFVTTKRGGIGVGLAISQTIVEAHGGKIWAEPNEQGGTTFHFTLPASIRDEVTLDA